MTSTSYTKSSRRPAPVYPGITSATLRFSIPHQAWQYAAFVDGALVEVIECPDIWTIREIVSYRQRPFRAFP